MAKYVESLKVPSRWISESTGLKFVMLIFPRAIVVHRKTYHFLFEQKKRKKEQECWTEERKTNWDRLRKGSSNQLNGTNTNSCDEITRQSEFALFV